MDDNQNLPHVAVNAQYIKDLSFEAPGGPGSLRDMGDPQIDLFLDLKVSPLPEENYYEVMLAIEAKSKNDKTTHYIIDLKYAGIFNLINIPSDQKNAILAVHCPAMIFPFARKIIADMTQDGGFQPLMIDPIDFGVLYSKKISSRDN